MANLRTWTRAKTCAESLQISECTLQRWRYSGLLQPGTHYKRKFAGNQNSPILYDLDRIELKLAKLDAADAKAIERQMR